MTQQQNEPEPDTAPAGTNRRSRIWLAAGAAAVVAAAVTVAAVAAANRDGAPDGASGGPPHAEAPADLEAVLVSTAWLEDNLDNPDVVVIEVSENRPTSGLTSYEEGHVPGAVELVWFEDFMQHEIRDLVTQEQFTELGQSAGIDDESTVVLYGDANNWFAAWGAWVFTYYGTRDVRLLDGGRNKWEAEGRPLEVVVPSPARGNYQALEPRQEVRAYLPEVLDSAVAESAQAAPAWLVDIRGPQEYHGEIGVAEGFTGEAAVKFGHIPNAVNVPWGSIVNDDGTYLPPDRIRQVYADAGVDGSKPIIVYCRIGERASHTWYALSQILGYNVKVYDGSWTEWGNAVGVPIQNNSAGGGLWSR
jgi:thiosulfate/3-mercaptopyruvate sulfurtransferase